VSFTTFDIETGPRPEEELKWLYEAPPEFDPRSVKYGNTTDPDKRARKLQEVQEKYESEVAAAWGTFVAEAPLSATTGTVVAIGYAGIDGHCFVEGLDDEHDEADLIGGFWEQFKQCRRNLTSMVGHNIHEFDLPFILQRSWVLDVPVPTAVIEKDRFWSTVFIDTLARWRCGARLGRAGLDYLAKALGLGAKNGDGAKFWRLWNGTIKEHAEAVRYLTNDVLLILRLAKRLGIV